MTPRANIREAVPTTPTSQSRAFFVRSARDVGQWWRVDFSPTATPVLTCSCPWGGRIARVLDLIARGQALPAPRACRHLIAVAGRLHAELAADVEAVA